MLLQSKPSSPAPSLRIVLQRLSRQFQARSLAHAVRIPSDKPNKYDALYEHVDWLRINVQHLIPIDAGTSFDLPTEL